MHSKYADKAIERAAQDIKELAALYNVSNSRICWMGNRNYIIVFEDGTELKI